MQLTVNGERKEFKPEITLHELLGELKISPQAVAVELNLNIVSKKSFENTTLKDGDKLEIISFVGGG